MDQDRVVVAVLAVRDVLYFSRLSRDPSWPWKQTIFLSFNEICDQIGRREGHVVLSVFKAMDSLSRTGDAGPRPEVRPMEAGRTIHEQVNNGLSRSAAIEKFWGRFAAIDRLMRPYNGVPVVQELGGFASNLALHAWTRFTGTAELVIEPAMFPGRLLFSRNSFFVDLRNVAPTAEDISAGQRAREALFERPAFLMPHKDRHFFRKTTIAKLLGADFQLRLWRKAWRRVVLRRREEFSYLSVPFVQNFKRLVRQAWLKDLYALPKQGVKFVYYPLHVPWDVQLTFRCPTCYDQTCLIERLAAALPADWIVLVKEHPAAVGSYAIKQQRRLVQSGRVMLAPPHLNSVDLSRDARAVVTVNSKVGFEAVMAGLPVITLGPSFYRGHGVTVDVDTPEEAAAAAVRGVPPASDDAVHQLVGKCWAATTPGELYVDDPAALATAARGFALARRTLLTPTAVSATR